MEAKAIVQLEAKRAKTEEVEAEVARLEKAKLAKEAKEEQFIAIAAVNSAAVAAATAAADEAATIAMKATKVVQDQEQLSQPGEAVAALVAGKRAKPALEAANKVVIEEAEAEAMRAKRKTLAAAMTKQAATAAAMRRQERAADEEQVEQEQKDQFKTIMQDIRNREKQRQSRVDGRDHRRRATGGVAVLSPASSSASSSSFESAVAALALAENGKKDKKEAEEMTRKKPLQKLSQKETGERAGGDAVVQMKRNPVELEAFAITKIQSMSRRWVARAQLVQEMQQRGTMLACPGTIQKQSGWYEYMAAEGASGSLADGSLSPAERQVIKWQIDDGVWTQIEGPVAKKDWVDRQQGGAAEAAQHSSQQNLKEKSRTGLPQRPMPLPGRQRGQINAQMSILQRQLQQQEHTRGSPQIRATGVLAAIARAKIRAKTGAVKQVGQGIATAAELDYRDLVLDAENKSRQRELVLARETQLLEEARKEAERAKMRAEGSAEARRWMTEVGGAKDREGGQSAHNGAGVVGTVSVDTSVPIAEWLGRLNPALGVYAAGLSANGYENVGMLEEASDGELAEVLADLGAKRPHQRRILRAAEALRAVSR
jgi:hypothetical protein